MSIALLVILLLSFLVALSFIFWSQVFKKARDVATREPSQSLSVSELKTLIHETVADATRSIDERLAALEANTQTSTKALEREPANQSPMPAPQPLLELPDDESDRDTADASSRRPARDEASRTP